MAFKGGNIVFGIVACIPATIVGVGIGTLICLVFNIDAESKWFIPIAFIACVITVIIIAILMRRIGRRRSL